MNKKSQVSTEYLVLIGFLTLVLIIILGIALFYSSSIQDSLKMSQIEDAANKIISSSESVFYSGEPSQSTISVYFPQGIKNITIIENSLLFTVQTSSGILKRAFSSNVPMTGDISLPSGLKRIIIKAEGNQVAINPA